MTEPTPNANWHIQVEGDDGVPEMPATQPPTQELIPPSEPVSEQAATPESKDVGGLDGILNKYDNDPQKLAHALKSLQQQLSKQQAQPPAAPIPGIATQEQQEGLMAAAAQAVGGEQQFNALSDWATGQINAGNKQVTQAVEAFQAGIQTGDAQRAQGAVAQLAWAKVQRYGWQPAPTLGSVGRGTSSQEQPLVSEGDIKRAFSDPRMDIYSPQFDEGYFHATRARVAL